MPMIDKYINEPSHAATACAHLNGRWRGGAVSATEGHVVALVQLQHQLLLATVVFFDQPEGV